MLCYAADRRPVQIRPDHIKIYLRIFQVLAHCINIFVKLLVIQNNNVNTEIEHIEFFCIFIFKKKM